MSIESDDILAAQLHDLKNSLALLVMNLDGIPRSGTPEHDGPLDAVRLLSGQIGDRLHQTLLLYRLDNQALPVNIDAHSPLDLLEELAASARSLAAGRFDVEMTVDKNVPAIWFFDRNLVEMGMFNAIHNSLAYARQRIRIWASLDDGFLTLNVKDDSAGYPQHILDCTIEGKACHSQGTGLGLRFASQIAQAHENHGRRGSLQLYNQGGACFSMRLP
jgi:K+-sensing histidine kinase KdpD